MPNINLHVFCGSYPIFPGETGQIYMYVYLREVKLLSSLNYIEEDNL